MMSSIKDLIGLTMTSVVNKNNEELVFVSSDGRRFKLYHAQDCCESVSIEDITGDLTDLEGSPILLAEEVTSNENPPGIEKSDQESFTWTFYKFATRKGYVDIRWYGDSNGYYSESVDFMEMEQ